MNLLMFNTIRTYRSKYVSATSRIEPGYTVVIVPIYQEILFRWVPFEFLYPIAGYFWLTGTILSLLFALTHGHLGKWFILYAFIGGLVLWYVVASFGLLSAILVHAVINIFDLKFGWRKYLTG